MAAAAKQHPVHTQRSLALKVRQKEGQVVRLRRRTAAAAAAACSRRGCVATLLPGWLAGVCH